MLREISTPILIVLQTLLLAASTPVFGTINTEILAIVNDEIVSKQDYYHIQQQLCLLHDIPLQDNQTIVPELLQQAIDYKLRMQLTRSRPIEAQHYERANDHLHSIQQSKSLSDRQWDQLINQCQLNTAAIQNIFAQHEAEMDFIIQHNQHHFRIQDTDIQAWVTDHSLFQVWSFHSVTPLSAEEHSQIKAIVEQSDDMPEVKQQLKTVNDQIKLIDYQYKQIRQLPSLFAEAIASSGQIKELMPSIEAPNGFHTLYINHVRDIPPDAVAIQAIEQDILNDVINKTMTQLRQDAYIKIPSA
ncbi:MAG: hypothetical protein CMF46_02670 [Legionellales bacterium]|nr:hypothetical protein [Legionellales bacterium]